MGGKADGIHPEEPARAFLVQLRRTQQESKLSLGGRMRLSPEQAGAIVAAFDNRVIASISETVGKQPITILLERFEELCRRHKNIPSPDLRPAIQELLAAELSVNAQAFRSFGLKPKNLASATLYHGDLTAVASDARWQKLPAQVMRIALRGRPMEHPQGFLLRVKNDMASLAAENEFAGLPPTALKYAALHQSDPRSFLRKVKQDITALSKDEEFAQFRDTPSKFWNAAVTAPKHPREFLRRCKEKDIPLSQVMRIKARDDDGEEGPGRY